MDTSHTIALQQALVAKGYPLTVDGRYGPQTAAALQAYRTSLGAASIEDPEASIQTPEPAKPWWASKAVIGAVATILVGIASVAGYALDPSQVGLVLSSLAGLITGGVSLYGSITRSAPIDRSLVAPGVRLERVRWLPTGDPGSAQSGGSPLDDPFVSGGG